MLTANHVVVDPNVSYIVKIKDEQHSVDTVKSLKEQTGLDLAVAIFTSNMAYSTATFGDSKYASAGANVCVSDFPLSVDVKSDRR